MHDTPNARSLMDAAVQAEHARHAARLAEVRKMAAKLRLLDAYMPAITAAGIELHGTELGYWSWAGAVRVLSATLNPWRNAKLEQVLRAQGMEETRREQFPDGSYTVELSRGPLRISLPVHVNAQAQATRSIGGRA